MTPSSETRKGNIWFLLLGGLFVGMCGAGIGTFAAFIHESPQIRALDQWRPTVNTTIYAADGSLLAELAKEERRTLVRLSEVPLNLQHAFLAAEDNRFYSHCGIDFVAIPRAALKDIKTRSRAHGASTITQQLARNLPIGLHRRRTWSRKAKEAFIALQIERKFTKDEILELYLNQINVGGRAHGVESGAQKYFGKHVGQLTLAECALLAGVARGPTRYYPFSHPERAVARRNVVLRLMLEKGYITKSAYDEAVQEPLTLRQYETEKPFAEYFVEDVRQYLLHTHGDDRLYQGGLVVETTLDPAMQRAAESAIENGLALYEQDRGEELPKDRTVQAALIAIEPSTGYIKAMVGGRDFEKSKFNRAVQAYRQPGSAFKPFIWAVALEKGFTASDVIDDFPQCYPYRDPETGERVEWCPENFEEHYFGPSTLRQAIVRSQNVVAVQLLQKVGLGPVRRLAHKAGIGSFLDRNYSIALGTSVVTPLELASAYATFANNGIHYTPLAIVSVHDAEGKLLEENRGKARKAMRAETAYLVTHLLRGVIEDDEGTGRNAQAFTRNGSRPAAGKTGTTEDCIDAWFVGYTPDLATAVWVGYDDNTSLGERRTGGRVACPIWTEFMLEVFGDKPATEFDKPENIVFVRVDWDTGEPAGPHTPRKKVIEEAFLRGTEPRSDSVS